jgi:hypothetical protein
VELSIMNLIMPTAMAVTYVRAKRARERSERDEGPLPRREGARLKRGGASEASEKKELLFCGGRGRERSEREEGALLRRERAGTGAVGGRPPEPPLRPARSHRLAHVLGRTGSHMCSAAQARSCARPHRLAHVLGHTCARPHML